MGCVKQEFIPEMMVLRIPELVTSFKVKMNAEILDARKSFANSFEYCITCFYDLINSGRLRTRFLEQVSILTINKRITYKQYCVHKASNPSDHTITEKVSQIDKTWTDIWSSSRPRDLCISSLLLQSIKFILSKLLKSWYSIMG